MVEKKELSNEELEQVTGGGGIGENNPNYSGFSGYVNMYSLSIGSEYYFTKEDDGVMWFRARVKDSYEYGLGWTTRYHTVFVTDKGTYKSLYISGVTYDIVGDDFAAYTTKN